MVGSARICAIFLVLQILQGQSDIQAKIVKEQVQRIVAGQSRRSSASGGRIGLRRGKLSRSAVALILPVAEEVNTKLVYLRPVDLDDLDLQLHLPDVRRSYHHGIDHNFRIQSGQLARRLGRSIAQHRAGERNAIQLRLLPGCCHSAALRESPFAGWPHPGRRKPGRSPTGPLHPTR